MAASLPPAEVAAFLRERAPGVLVAVGTPAPRDALVRFPQIFGDGFVKPADEPDAQLAAGRYNQVPVILGTNRDENKLFMAFDTRYVRLWFRVLPCVRDRSATTATPSTRRSPGSSTAPTSRRAGCAASRARACSSTASTGTSWAAPLGGLDAVIGAAHAVEIPFVFGDFDIPLLSSLMDDDNVASRRALARR